MRLESLSSIVEICPYYGTLDAVFRLLNSLWIKTRKIWKDSKAELQKYVNRIKIRWGVSNYSWYDMLIKNQLILWLFEDQDLHASNEIEYEAMIYLIDNINEPEMVSNFELYFSETRDLKLTLETCEDYMKNDDLKFIDYYNRTLKKLKDKRFDFSKIWSYVFAEELHFVREWEFIKMVIFRWTETASSKKLIEVWNEF